MKRVAVDPRRCQGHNRCVDIAEQLFEPDDEGYVHVIGTGALAAADQLDRARLAEANCPERAISITDSAGDGADQGGDDDG